MKSKFIILLLVFITMSRLSFAQISTDSLIAYYPLNGDAGDSSGNGNHGFMYYFEPSADRFGQPDNALFAPGQVISGDFSSIFMPVNSIPTGRSPRTICFWFKLQPGYNSLYLEYGEDDPNKLFSIFIDFNGIMYFDSDNGAYGLNSATSTLDGNWHFGAVTYDSVTVKLYCDGVYEDSVDAVLETASTLISSSLYDIGNLDEVRVYNRALSASELNLIFNDGCAADIPQTIGASRDGGGVVKLRATGGKTYKWYDSPFGGNLKSQSQYYTTEVLSQSDTFWVANVDGCESARIQAIATICDLSEQLQAYYMFDENGLDTSGNAHHGTISGATFVPDRKGIPNHAIQLDGISNSVDLGPWFNYQDFTISMWVKGADIQNTHADIMDNNHTGARSWVIQYGNVADTFLFGTQNTLEGIYFNVPEDVWVNYVFVHTQFENKVFKNGELLDKALNAGTIYYDGTQFLRIGRWGSGGRYFKGSIDEVRIYNRELSETEIYLIGHEMKTQTITFGLLSTKTLSVGTFTLKATATSGLPVTYTSSNPSVASVSGNVVTIHTVGTTAITASQTGDSNWDIAEEVQRFLTVKETTVEPPHTSDVIISESQKLVVFPTRVSDVLYFEGNTLEIVRVEIVNLTGEKVISCQVTEGSIDMSGLKSGLYIVQILFNDNSVKRVKIIKE